MAKIKRVRIEGLFGDRTVDIRPTGDTLILVGPNGIGKSSVINILYFFISRQWPRLLEYNFDLIELETSTGSISARREDITGLSELGKVLQDLPTGSRFRSVVERLTLLNELEGFLEGGRLSLAARRRYAEILGLPVEEIVPMQSFLRRRSLATEGSLFSAPRVSLEKSLQELFPSRTLYLPTYRRIEKDLREIFPDFEERYRSHMGGVTFQAFGRSAPHYIDLVSFGMEDVRKNFDRRTREMRDYSLAQYNNLSALYLRDVIRGSADHFSSRKLSQLTEDGIGEILGRVSETTLTKPDKELLLQKVQAIRGVPRAKVDINDRFLAHYFTRLIEVHEEIKEREASITAYVEVCNAYLGPSKEMRYDENDFKIEIFDERGRPLDLSVLSSGEKQVVSIFSHLYLDDERNQVVIIDEPELSLSVPWQKRFLVDIIETGKCEFLAAVTHSPFIYDNALKRSAVDLRRRLS